MLLRWLRLRVKVRGPAGMTTSVLLAPNNELVLLERYPLHLRLGEARWQVVREEKPRSSLLRILQILAMGADRLAVTR